MALRIPSCPWSLPSDFISDLDSVAKYALDTGFLIQCFENLAYIGIKYLTVAQLFLWYNIPHPFWCSTSVCPWIAHLGSVAHLVDFLIHSYPWKMMGFWSMVIYFIMGGRSPEENMPVKKKKKKDAAQPVSMLFRSIFALKWFKCMWLWGCLFFQPDLLHWLGLVIEGERANQARKRIKRKNRRKWKLPHYDSCRRCTCSHLRLPY